MSSLDRRTFLKGVGQGVVATSLLGMDLPYGAWLTADAQESQAAFNEKKVECDVLVIGGGFAGCYAAIKAKEQGANVVMIDKGYAGRSGQSPLASNAPIFDPKTGNLEDAMRSVGRQTEYLGNRYWVETILQNSNDRYQELLRMGVQFKQPQRAGVPAASAFSKPRPVQMVSWDFGYIPYQLRQQVERVGVKILDRVMLVEYMKQNGRVVGAVGISSASNTYDMYTIVAKAIVQAIGACGYQAPAYPMGHQLTGDGEAAAWRAGAEVLGKEFVMTHWTRTDIPLGDSTALWTMDIDKIPAHLKELRTAGVGSGVSMVDAEGNKLPDRPQEASQYIFSTLNPEFAAHAGKAPIYSVTSDGTKTAIVGGMMIGMSIRHGDGIWAADKQCGSSIPGLYAAGDALGTCGDGATYGGGTPSAMGAMVTGAIAGTNAAKEAAKMDKPAVHPDEIARAKRFISVPKERKGGFGPRWVTRLLQNTMTPYFIYYIKKADRLQAALTHIEFMQEHLVPMLIARDPHELRLAHETRSMVLSAEFRLRSALFRNESRGNHYREDFPRRDDKNWLAWTKIKSEQGKMTLVKVPIPKEWGPDESIPYEQRYPTRFPGE